MADTIGQQDIRGLDIQKALKGFALTEFVFKNLCNVATTSGDSVRWYQETSDDLTATSPARVANVGIGSAFTNLEPSWTRNLSAVKKYSAESTIPIEDAKGSDFDVVSRTLLRLTRAVAKQVDTDIWNVITESQSASTINSVTTTSIGGDQWDAASGQNPVKDVVRALRLIANEGYDISNAELWVSPVDYESLIIYAYAQGSQAPMLGDRMATDAVLTKFAGAKVRVSVNVTTDYAAVLVPSTACTFYQFTPLSVGEEEHKGKDVTYRVWEVGIATLTDPKAVTLIIDTQS